jgi:DUF4097 and DUF4098 domain-containing protein YvlB
MGDVTVHAISGNINIDKVKGENIMLNTEKGLYSIDGLIQGSNLAYATYR